MRAVTSPGRPIYPHVERVVALEDGIPLSASAASTLPLGDDVAALMTSAKVGESSWQHKLSQKSPRHPRMLLAPGQLVNGLAIARSSSMPSPFSPPAFWLAMPPPSLEGHPQALSIRRRSMPEIRPGFSRHRPL